MEQFKNVAACRIGVYVASTGHRVTVDPGKIVDCDLSDVEHRVARGQFAHVEAAAPPEAETSDETPAKTSKRKG